MKALLISILLSTLFLSGCSKNKSGGTVALGTTEESCAQFGEQYDREHGRKAGVWNLDKDGHCSTKSVTIVKKTEQECIQFGAAHDKEQGQPAGTWTADPDGNCTSTTISH